MRTPHAPHAPPPPHPPPPPPPPAPPAPRPPPAPGRVTPPAPAALLGAATMLALLAAPGALPGQSLAITGGKVYPVSGPPLENATVLIRNGRIAAVGSNVAIPADAQRIDASGKWVTPGLVNAATVLGLLEGQFSGGYQDNGAKG